MSHCRSFGSNIHSYSQSRKISIGVVVNPSSNTRPKTFKEDETTVVELIPKHGLSSDDGHKGEGVVTATTGKQIEDPEKETSPWVSTRSFNQQIPTPENGTGVRFFAAEVSVLHSSDGKQRRFNRVACRRKEGNAEGVEDLSFATPHKVFVPDKELVEEKTNRPEIGGSETLRTKLWEILGTVSSPNKQFSGSHAFKEGASNLKRNQRSDEHGNPVSKPRQNSDTIESDSENPDHTVRRPMTRSLTRKRASTKVQLKKKENIPLSNYKPKPLKNRFYFKEGWSGRFSNAVNGGSSMSKRNKSEQKSYRIEPRRISSPGQENVDEIQQSIGKSKTTDTAENLQLFRNRTGSFCGFLPKKTSEFVEPKNGIPENDFHQSPVTKMTDQPEDYNDPTLQENVDQQEGFANPSFTDIVDPPYNLQRPSFDMKTSTKRSSPDFLPKVNHRELEEHIPEERVVKMEGIHRFKSLLASTANSNETIAQMESSEDAGEPEDSHVLKSVPIMEEKDTANSLSKSSTEESDFESFQDCSSSQGLNREGECLFPDIGIVEKKKFGLPSSKRLRSQEFPTFIGFSPRSDSPKGTGESNGFQGNSEENQEDGLASAVPLFALALERVKSKMKSATSKKSAEILMSVAEKIHLQLQNAESRIQMDVRSLTSLTKSKQKCLATRLQEQKKQLKDMHERFKGEVNQHIQDCMSTVAGLEAQQIEFKGIVEKQKASHRKLILQAEEEIETQLNDAQRTITAVHKLAREKMLQLKHLIAECLQESILN